MVRGGRWRLTLFSVGVTLTAAASGLVTNLVSSGVTLKGWQWPAMWAAFGVLLLGAVGLDVHRTLSDPAAVDEGDAEEDGFAEVRRRYSERLQERYRQVDLHILLPSEQSEHPTMPLDVVFVPQLVRDDPPPRELLDLPREMLLRLVESGTLPELPEGVDRVRLERAERAYRDRPARPVLAAVAAAPRGVVVLGDPGAGKSTLARYLMLALAAGELGAGAGAAAELPGDLAGRLPLVVELRRFTDPRWEDAEFLDFLGDRYVREGFGLPRGMLAGFLRSGGRALAVFDGLDEIFEPKRRNAVARQIDWFARSHPNVRVVVTSRVIGYEREEFDRAGFTTLMLQDLTRRQITRFTTTWSERSCPGRPEDAARLRNRVLGAVEGSSAVAELAGNPMLLTILAIIARRRELPRDRISVYEHAVMLLVDQWDASRELAGQVTGLPSLEARDKLSMLRSIARRMQDAPAGLAGNHLLGDDLTELFRDYFTGRLGLPPDRAVQAARAMLRQLRDRNYILAGYGADLYGFVHRAFLEYLAAADISRRFADRALSVDELQAVFGTRWRDPAWTEVLLLLAGQLPERFAGAAVAGLLDADPVWRARTTPPRHLVLALRIAGEMGDSPALAPHARALTIAVIELFKTTLRKEPVSGPWTDALRRAVSPLLTPSPGRRWPDHELYQRWCGDFVPPSASADPPAIALAMSCWLALKYRTLPELVRPALHNEDVHVRRAAVAAVGRGWAGDPEVLAWLCERAIRDGSYYVRSAAVWAIASNYAGDPDAIAYLRDRVAAHEDHPDVQQAAILAVSSSGDDSPETLEWLRGRATSHSDESVRATAVRAVSSLAADAPDTFAWLHERAALDPHHRVRRAAVEAVGSRWAGTPEALAWLHGRATRDPSTIVRAVAVHTMGIHWGGNPEALELLRDRATDDEDGYVREYALYAVGYSGAGTAETLAWLDDRATHDPSDHVRAAAMQPMGACWAGDAEAFGLLRDRAARDEDGLVQRAAVRALGVGWAGDPKVLEFLRNLILEGDESVRKAAVDAVGAGWAGNPYALRILRFPAAWDRDADVRQSMVDAVGAGWAGNSKALKILRNRIHDKDASVRKAAVEAIGSGWPNSPAALRLLRNCAARVEDEGVRQAAVALLAYLG